MCRVTVEKDGLGRVTGRIIGHEGLCLNGLWFDVHNGDTVFLCVHPDNDPNKAPTLTRSLSLAAWQQVVAHIANEVSLPVTVTSG